jgi:hypothetical protein
MHVKNTWNVPKAIGAIVIVTLALTAAATIWFGDGKMMTRVNSCHTLLCPQMMGIVQVIKWYGGEKN